MKEVKATPLSEIGGKYVQNIRNARVRAESFRSKVVRSITNACDGNFEITADWSVHLENLDIFFDGSFAFSIVQGHVIHYPCWNGEFTYGTPSYLFFDDQSCVLITEFWTDIFNEVKKSN